MFFPLSVRTRRLVPVLVAGAASLLALPALAQPTFSKSFSPGTIGAGSASRLIFQIDNASGTPVTALAFVDNLPADVVLASPPSATSPCGVGASSPRRPGAARSTSAAAASAHSPRARWPST